MIRVREYRLYKDNEFFDYDLNLFARTFGLEVIKTEQLGIFEDEDLKESYYKVLIYFDVPEELEPLEEFLCDCTCEFDEKDRYYEGYMELGYWSRKAIKEIYGNRIVFENEDDDGGGGTVIKMYVK